MSYSMFTLHSIDIILWRIIAGLIHRKQKSFVPRFDHTYVELFHLEEFL